MRFKEYGVCRKLLLNFMNIFCCHDLNTTSIKALSGNISDKKKANQELFLTSPYAPNVYNAPLIYRYATGVRFVHQRCCILISLKPTHRVEPEFLKGKTVAFLCQTQVLLFDADKSPAHYLRP